MSSERLGNAWTLMGMVNLSVFLAFVKVFEIPPIIPLLSAELEATYEEIGVLMSSYTVVVCVASFAIGLACDWWGPIRVLRLGLLFLATFGVSGTLVDSYALMVTFRILVALGVTAVFIAGLDIISKVIQVRKVGLGMGLYTASVNLGLTAALLLTPILSDKIGWRWTLRSSSVACLALLVALLLQNSSAASPAESAHDAAPKRFSKSLLNPIVIFLAIAMGLVLFQIYGIATWIPPYLKDVLHYSASEVGSTSMLLGLGTIPASIVVGWLAKTRREMVWLFVTGALLSSGVILLLIASEGWSLALIACFIALIAWGTTQTSISILGLASLTTKNTGEVLGVVYTIGFIGPILSTYLGGFIVTRTHHYNISFVAFATSALVAVFAILSVNLLMKATNPAIGASVGTL